MIDVCDDRNVTDLRPFNKLCLFFHLGHTAFETCKFSLDTELTRGHKKTGRSMSPGRSFLRLAIESQFATTLSRLLNALQASSVGTFPP
jgi:hypothetical protein